MRPTPIEVLDSAVQRYMDSVESKRIDVGDRVVVMRAGSYFDEHGIVDHIEDEMVWVTFNEYGAVCFVRDALRLEDAAGADVSGLTVHQLLEEFASTKVGS